MNCPKCNSTHGSEVTNSRYRPTIELTYRRRRCLNPECKERFTTYELIADEEETSLNRSIGTSIIHGRSYGEWVLRYI